MPAASTRKPKLTILRAASLEKLPWLIHGFSTRPGGYSRAYGGRTLNLGITRHDSRIAVERNRADFIKQLGAMTGKNPWPMVTLRQIHSDLIHCVDTLPSQTLAGDGLITSTPRLLLSVLTADCLPVILADTKHSAIGVFHAGWRGTVKRIVEKGVGEMRRWFGTRPRDLRAAIGPGIHDCCFQVGSEVREQFESQFEYGAELFREIVESNEVREKYPLLFLTARAPGHSELPRKIFLDLAEANRRQLLAVGVPAAAIEISPLCTACRLDLLFSHRAEKGMTGRQAAVVGIN